tara:strand:+ start:1026 stop:1493 length:468 start_codon:yes stop_codon:yes gene_type:complete
MTEWKFNRVNSKGDAVFRRDTNESIDFVENYLIKNGISYYGSGHSMLYIENNIGVEYVYYYTTGRWSKKKKTYDKHYHSKGIEHFVTAYLNNYSVEQQTKQKEWDLEKQERDAKRVKEQSKTTEEKIAELMEKRDAVNARRTELRRAKNAIKKSS